MLIQTRILDRIDIEIITDIKKNLLYMKDVLTLFEEKGVTSKLWKKAKREDCYVSDLDFCSISYEYDGDISSFPFTVWFNSKGALLSISSSLDEKSNMRFMGSAYWDGNGNLLNISLVDVPIGPIASLVFSDKSSDIVINEYERTYTSLHGPFPTTIKKYSNKLAQYNPPRLLYF